MPTNTTILMVRHAEKPTQGPDLAVAGRERAQAYSIYFQNYCINNASATPCFLFATKASSESNRPVLTMTPLATALSLSIDHCYADDEHKKLANHICDHSKYNNSNILICWHHGKILKLAEDLGVVPSDLPPTSKWPSDQWPTDVFGWVLQICYDGNGNIIPAQTLCKNQQLMYDDNGKNPPLPLVIINTTANEPAP